MATYYPRNTANGKTNICFKIEGTSVSKHSEEVDNVFKQNVKKLDLLFVCNFSI